jgi:hypothetical protein
VEDFRGYRHDHAKRAYDAHEFDGAVLDLAEHWHLNDQVREGWVRDGNDQKNCDQRNDPERCADSDETCRCDRSSTG